MSPEARRIYRVGSSDPVEINRVLASLADRLDQMEGFRDTPHLRAALNLGGNKATNASSATAATDVPIKSQLAEAWPIGSIFIAVVSTSPATLLGFGTWAAFGAGKVLVGLDSSDTDFDVVRDTGGAKTHTHSTPAHVHPAGTDVAVGAGETVNDGSGGSGTTGSGSSLMPYITVYMWERTA